MSASNSGSTIPWCDRPKKYTCKFCEKKFVGRNDLRKHERIHTDERPYICNDCGAGFRQGGSLKNHIAAQHSAGLQSSEIFVCNYCQKAFPIKERLRLHLRVHTGVKPYICKLCDKSFARGGQLVQHSRVHTGSRPYKCAECHVTFTSAANLRQHYKRHDEIRDFICDICGKGFYRRDALRKHLDSYHGNQRPWHCTICNKDYKGHLTQHIRTHTKEKPHGCAHCKATFAQRSQLIVHQRIHSGEKPYRCKVCWQAFAHSTALQLHIRRHTGEKPFTCLLCAKGTIFFTQLPHLKKHVQCVHKSNKAHICKYCLAKYKLKTQLEMHLNTCKKYKERAEEERLLANEVDTPMSLTNMRFLVAVLLKKISTPDKLKDLGFNKRLIDDVLIKSIEDSGRKPCVEEGLTVAGKFKKNVEILLEWTIPQSYMEKFRNQQRSTEELLEELT